MKPTYARTVLTFAGIALAAAVVRFFLKPVLAPLGVPTVVGSLLASITIVLLIGTIFIFRQAGKDPNGRYLKAAAWCFALNAWCHVLIISGILLSEWSGIDTYFLGPWEMVKEQFPTTRAHIIGHTQGFWFLTVILVFVVGGITYAVSSRARKSISVPVG